jgi:hypothetical protein
MRTSLNELLCTLPVDDVRINVRRRSGKVKFSVQVTDIRKRSVHTYQGALSVTLLHDCRSVVVLDRAIDCALQECVDRVKKENGMEDSE